MKRQLRYESIIADIVKRYSGGENGFFRYADDGTDVCVEAHIEPDSRILDIWDIRGDSRSKFYAENIEKAMVEPGMDSMLSVMIEGGSWVAFVPYAYHAKVKQVIRDD
jgi:hypothetical protein